VNMQSTKSTKCSSRTPGLTGPISSSSGDKQTKNTLPDPRAYLKHFVDFVDFVFWVRPMIEDLYPAGLYDAKGQPVGDTLPYLSCAVPAATPPPWAGRKPPPSEARPW